MLLSIPNISQNNYTTSATFFKSRTTQPAHHALVMGSDEFVTAPLNPAEQEKYDKILNSLPTKSILEFENLRKHGILTNKKSNDESSTLDNLHKILTEERVDGLDSKTILAETIAHLNNPYNISQKSDNSISNYLEAVFSPKTQLVGKENSSTCTAACIEFDLATQEPAEFVRFVEGLTSSRKEVEKTIDLNNLADNVLDAIWLLNIFEIPYEQNDFEKVKLTLKPDNLAFLKIGLDKKRMNLPKQRNSIDTLMQSTFMNVGSQQSYNSLTDRREGNFNATNRGLIEYEKTFVESVVRNKNIISVNYQKINENGEITGYEADFDTIRSQLLDTLTLGENIVAGLTNMTASGKLRGHEIVITGALTNKAGKTEFLCYNSDIDKTAPVKYSEDYLLSHLHHAGIPKAIVQKTMGFQEGWVLGLENYKKMAKHAQ